MLSQVIEDAGWILQRRLHANGVANLSSETASLLMGELGYVAGRAWGMSLPFLRSRLMRVAEPAWFDLFAWALRRVVKQAVAKHDLGECNLGQVVTIALRTLAELSDQDLMALAMTAIGTREL